MAKQGSIRRELKREHLCEKYNEKRKIIKQSLSIIIKIIAYLKITINKIDFPKRLDETVNGYFRRISYYFFLKYLIKERFPIWWRILQSRYQKIPRNALPSRRQRRCWITGRSRGVYRDFGLSRHCLREMGSEGLIPGLIKSSW